MHMKYLLHIARDGKIDIVQKQHLKLSQITKIEPSNHSLALAKKKKSRYGRKNCDRILKVQLYL